MIGNQLLNLKYLTNQKMIKYIEEYMKLFEVSHMKGNFIPGTIFWIKGSVLKNILRRIFY